MPYYISKGLQIEANKMHAIPKNELIRRSVEAILGQATSPLTTAALAEILSSKPDSDRIGTKALYNCLYDDPSRFVRVSPGMWTLKIK
jgi:hypothetical protein